MNIPRRSTLTALLAGAAWPLAAHRAAAAPLPAGPLQAGSLLAGALQAGRAPIPIGLMTGEIAGTFIQVGNDVAEVLDSPDMRILPIIGKGSLQNLLDLVDVPGVDLAFAATDTLTFAAKLHPDLPGRIQYICKLYDNDVHVLAGPDITRIEDLHDKPVNIDVVGSGTAVTSTVMFQALGIPARFVNNPPTKGLEMLKAGEIAAITYAIGKPGRLFTQSLPPGLHLLPVPLNAELAKSYLPGSFTHEDYPGLVPAGQSVDTIAVGVALACFGWPSTTARYRNLTRFAELFFAKFPELLKPPHHAKWKDVNLASQVPGWRRFPPVESLLAAGQSAQAFEQFLDTSHKELTPAQKQTMIEEFRRTVAR